MATKTATTGSASKAAPETETNGRAAMKKLISITTPCFNGVTVCADPDHTLFWDEEHPTVFGHSFFAVATEQALASQ